MFATVVVNQKTKDSWLLSLSFLGFPLVPQLGILSAFSNVHLTFLIPKRIIVKLFHNIVTVVL